MEPISLMVFLLKVGLAWIAVRFYCFVVQVFWEHGDPELRNDVKALLCIFWPVSIPAAFTFIVIRGLTRCTIWRKK